MNLFYKNIGKRIFDILLALPAFFLLSPIMLMVIILLLITGHRRMFFIQKRVGLNDRVFSLFKFRTMTDAKDASGKLLPDAIRLTKAGMFIRKTSLDELPQLLNVILGNMSLIGPRPLLTEYLPLYSMEQRRRHLVRPGITGWAQVNGRNVISWEKKFEYDVWYVDHFSFSLDMRIIALTIKNIIRAEGISQEGQATVEAFTGKK